MPLRRSIPWLERLDGAGPKLTAKRDPRGAPFAVTHNSRDYPPTPPRLEEFGVCHSDRGMMAGHIAIPIFSAEGELLAYAGRDTGTSEVVYKYPEKFRRELELYNLHRALASCRAL